MSLLLQEVVALEPAHEATFDVNGGPTERGVYLYPWDHDQPRQFVNLPVPAGFFDDPRSVQVSDRGNVMVVSESTLISVIYFVDAMLGLD